MCLLDYVAVVGSLESRSCKIVAGTQEKFLFSCFWLHDQEVTPEDPTPPHKGQNTRYMFNL